MFLIRFIVNFLFFTFTRNLKKKLNKDSTKEPRTANIFPYGHTRRVWYIVEYCCYDGHDVMYTRILCTLLLRTAYRLHPAYLNIRSCTLATTRQYTVHIISGRSGGGRIRGDGIPPLFNVNINFHPSTHFVRNNTSP